MSIRITDVKLNTNYNWENIKDLGDWNSVKNTNTSWNQIQNISVVGQVINIEVSLIENNWLSIYENFSDWNSVKNGFNNWLDISKY